jgi:putative SOS response-associated peptidase YedK
MCGRFVGYSKLDQLRKYFSIDVANATLSPNYNIAPTQEVLAIARHDNQNCLEMYHWGLVPFWAKDKSIGNRMINARVETVVTKPSFRNAFKKRRCLILADGFYEWKGSKGSKVPMFITLPDQSPFAFAGLWESWGEETSLYQSCTILTREASEPIQPGHPSSFGGQFTIRRSDT